MKLNRNILLMLVLSAGLVGCDDFLEPKSQYEFVPKDANSMNEILLYEAYPRRLQPTTLNIFLNLLDDDISCMGKYQTPVTGFNPDKYWAPYTWQGDMYEVMKQANAPASNTDIYSTYYDLIKGANAVIDYIDQVNPTEEERNYLLGQAYALRGFYYLMLTNIFGQPYNAYPDGLGVPLKITVAIEERDLTRNSVKECYAQILEDLHNAETCYLALPYERQWKSDKRTSLPMIQLLLSRTYLYMENWQKASEYASKVMNDSRFALQDLTIEPNFSTSFTFNSYASTEAIWIYGEVADMAGASWGIAEPYSSTSRFPYFRASDELLSALRENAGDARAKKYVVVSGRKYVNNATVPLAFGKVPVSPSTVTTTSDFKPLTSDITVLGRSLRVSEAYLNYMEAEANLGNSSNALNALNDLRKTRIAAANYSDETIAGKEELLQFIHNERRRELCWEGQRWFDLRRWGMPSITHKWIKQDGSYLEYVLNEGDPAYTVPIPDRAIERNTHLKQNPIGPTPRNAVNEPSNE